MPLSTTPPSMSGEDHPADYDSLEQAARWYASLHVGQASEDERLAWQAWLDERPQNRRAWRHVETVSLRFAPLRADGERDAASVAISVSSSQAKKRRLVLRSMAALGGVGLATWGLLRISPVADAVLAWNADYRTRIGEVNDFLLPDGTHLWLNTNSAVDVTFGDERRLLKLRLGEVLIDTGRDPAGRPFFVETGAGRMQALGTRFMVRQLEETTCLSVFAGRVEIQTASGQRAIVEAGQERRFTAGSLSEADVANPTRQAWTRGAIVAEDLPLGELAAELARYQRGYINVSPAIATLRVSGRYPINDLPKAIGMLERDFPLQVSRPIPWWTSIGARTP